MSSGVNRREFLVTSAIGAGALALPLSGTAAGAPQPGGSSPLRIDRLTVEYAEDLLGCDVAKPRFGWVLSAEGNGTRQTAYQVVVSTAPGGRNVVWDSNRIASSSSVGVGYEGPALRSRTRYYWRVRVWDGNGVATSWSGDAWWETALLGESWGASWIGTVTPEPLPTVDGASWVGAPGWTTNSAPAGRFWFRGAVALPVGKEIARAVVVATADDDFTLYVGGVQVLSTPQQTDGWKTARAAVVTEAVTGPRVVLASVMNNRGTGQGNPGGLLVKLVVSFTDGSRTEFVTGSGWRVSATEQSGWETTGFDDSTWESAIVLAPYGGGLWGNNVSVATPERPAPVLRREFSVSKPVVRARLYIAGLAYYDAQLNGSKVGNQVLDPGFTDYDKTVLYAVHDVGASLRRGKNTIDVTLGRGFYGMTTPNVWGWHRPKWRGEPRLLAKLVVDHPDGSATTIATDQSWLVADGPTVTNSLYSGETYDARVTPSEWKPVSVVAAPKGRLRAQPNEPIRVVDTITPTRVSELKPGVHVVDMGRTMAGWTRITVRAAAGTKITLVHGERLNADGSVRFENGHVQVPRHQQDEYICSGRGTETWEPRFSYKGFRYVQITGARPVEVRGRLVHSDVPEVSTFRCSKPYFEQLDRMMRRTILNNLHSIPTDTPMYEKNGWTGDAQVGAPTMAYAFGMQRFFTKWIGDLVDSQNAAGQLPVIVPSGGWGYRELAPSPEWTTVFPFLVREMYRWYGDSRLAADCWPVLVRYMDWEIARMVNGLVETALGDYLAPDAPGGVPDEDTRITATAFFYRALLAVAELGELLGHKETAARYRGVASAAKDKMNETFLRDGHYRAAKDKGYRQTSNAVPLAFGMVPPGAVKSVVDSLVADIRARGDHLNTGTLGTSVLLPVLTAHGYPDVANALAVQHTYPSWGYWVREGADTMWEMWHADSRSRDHYFQGTVTQWLYENVAGLRPLDGGYERFVVKPDMQVDLDWAQTSIETVRGRVFVGWSRIDRRVRVEVVVPVGATAEVHVPGGGVHVVGHGKWQFVE
ncbi:family 78 glycoside hydrolase catalytic domain [Allokutzneria oryzae]|uniref:alpha-L-rhamnosidase n=1 Tax=Allokutzneria oryzae TaxID=1378989 RepID=A0ABV5ZR15_9PSEU